MPCVQSRALHFSYCIAFLLKTVNYYNLIVSYIFFLYVKYMIYLKYIAGHDILYDIAQTGEQNAF